MVAARAIMHATLLTQIVTTVADNMRQYTKRIFTQAKTARQLMVRLGYASSQATFDVLDTGMSHCDVTKQDVCNADVIFWSCIPSLRGKTHKRKPTPGSPVLTPRVTQVQQIFAVDLFFIKKLPFLLGQLVPLGLALCIPTKNRTASVIAAGIRSFKIKIIKERVRAHENSLPYVMTRLLLTMCVLFCVSRLNMQLSRVSVNRTCPLEKFTGRKINAARDLRVRFGDYIQATVSDNDNKMRSRIHGCIALLPTGNLTGSVKMWCPLETNSRFCQCLISSWHTSHRSQSQRATYELSIPK
jgi:hypothetical protein